jgi:tetratricopeptide (TPR) repeat protein
LESAKERYQAALDVDKENEYALANMGVINLK